MGSITVNNLGKAYKQYPTKLSRLKEWVLPSSYANYSLKWILKDITFEIKAGEAVGIIGINGAGKSTLLKMIAGTVKQSTGSININGRLAAILELGMGFHPDFTGRQNALLAGQLLGYSSEQINILMPEIEAFAEIGDYIDQPVRVYSSGMQVRLAFSVATAVRPDILIIDEALSVGDTYFQHKSFDRIRQFRQLGTTLIIVSHDKSAIQSICDRAILINNGKLSMEGKPEDVMDYYNALLADHQGQVVKKEKADNGRVQTISGIGLAHILAVSFLDANNHTIELIGVGEFVTLEIKVKCDVLIPKLILGYMIKDKLGIPIYGTNTELKSMPLLNAQPDLEYIFGFNFYMNLGSGTYSISVALTSSETHLTDNYEWRDHALVFSVVNTHHEKFLGCAWLNPDVLIKVENESCTNN